MGSDARPSRHVETCETEDCPVCASYRRERAAAREEVFNSRADTDGRDARLTAFREALSTGGADDG